MLVNTFVRILFVLLLIGMALSVFAQQNIEGIIFDQGTKQRVGRVMLTNLTTGERIFNNSRGEFTVPLRFGDVLVSSKENYFADTLHYSGQKVLVVNLKREAIEIAPVTVVARKTPDQILNDRKRDYTKAYRLADPGSLISVGDNGAGLSIDAVYNYFSKGGKNARRLTKYFQREYEDNVIDLRFSRELVRNTTGLEGESLDNFLVRYRPSYEFVMGANHYQLVSYIKSKYEFFKFVPYIKPLPDLNAFDLSPKE